MPIDRERRRAGFLTTITGDDGVVLVALENERIIGQLSSWLSRQGIASMGMCIAAPARQRGIGTALMERWIAWARQAGAHKLTLEVFPHNERARRLYKRFGFEEEGYFRKHYRRKNGEFEDAIPMSLWL